MKIYFSKSGQNLRFLCTCSVGWSYFFQYSMEGERFNPFFCNWIENIKFYIQTYCFLCLNFGIRITFIDKVWVEFDSKTHSLMHNDKTCKDNAEICVNNKNRKKDKQHLNLCGGWFCCTELSQEGRSLKRSCPGCEGVGWDFTSPLPSPEPDPGWRAGVWLWIQTGPWRMRSGQTGLW